MISLFVVLGFCVIAVGIAYQLWLSKWSNKQILSPVVGSSSKLSQKPLTDVNTANSPSYATSPSDQPSKNVSTASVHTSLSQHSPSSDVVTAKSPVYETPAPYQVPSVENEQQPSNNVRTATSPKIEEDQPSTAVSASSAGFSTGGFDDDKKAKKKKHKKSHSKHKKNKGGKESKKRDKDFSSSFGNNSCHLAI